MTDPSPIYVDLREKERVHPHDATRTVGTDMLTLLRSHRTHPTAHPKQLGAGDFCFSGNGPEGPVLVGIERKTVKGLLSDIRTGRLSGEQLPKLFTEYGPESWLVVEGRYRSNWTTGMLEVKKGREWVACQVGTQTFVALEMEAYLNTLQMCTPLHVKHTVDERGTVEFILGLHHSYSKPWEKHSAHVAIHRPQNHVTVGKASTLRRAAFVLDGIGWDKSGLIERHFPSLYALCQADVKALEKVKDPDGKVPGIGKVLAQKVYEQIRGLRDDGVF